MIFTLISLGTFTFGALAFSVLAVTYAVERVRGRAREGGVFPVFVLVCAFAFALNLLWQSWLLDLVTGLIPALLFHLVHEEERLRPRWVPFLFYPAAFAGFAETGAVILLGAAGCAGLLAQLLSRRALTQVERRHRGWTRLLLVLTLASAVASYWQVAPWVNLLPDYLVLAFFAVTLYYKERLTFFDLFLKRGAFFATGLIVLSLFFAFRTTPPWLDALLLAPFVARRAVGLRPHLAGDRSSLAAAALRTDRGRAPLHPRGAERRHGRRGLRTGSASAIGDFPDHREGE
jgi:hypothetical protein